MEEKWSIIDQIIRSCCSLIAHMKTGSTNEEDDEEIIGYLRLLPFVLGRLSDEEVYEIISKLQNCECDLDSLEMSAQVKAEYILNKSLKGIQ